MQRLLYPIWFAVLLFGLVALSGCGAPEPEDLIDPPPAPVESNRATELPAATPDGSVAQSIGNIEIRDPSLVPPQMESPRSIEGEQFGNDASSLFLTIVNQGDTADALTLVETNAAAAVEFFLVQPVQHFSSTTTIEIPANSYMVLDPGPGYHIIIHDFVRDVAAGDTIDLTLTFDQAGEVTTQADVRAPPRGRGQPGQGPGQGQPGQGPGQGQP
jgi:hypothetical protein